MADAGKRRYRFVPHPNPLPEGEGIAVVHPVAVGVPTCTHDTFALLANRV